MKVYYDSRNNQLCCINAYDCKEALKTLGFRWNRIGSEWFVACPDAANLGNLICDLFADCGLDYYDVCDLINSLPADRAECMMMMDDAHMAKFQAAAENY